MVEKEFRGSYLILVGAISVLLGYHFFGYIGHYGVDDMLYAKLASSWNNGTLDLNEHFSFRLPVIVLTALCYRIFGVNDFASSLPSMLFSVGVVLMVFQALKSKGNLILALGLIFTLLNEWFIFYADKLMPDMYVAFSVFGSLYIIQHYKFEYTNKEKPLKHALALAFFLLLGFTAKGTIVLFLPPMVFLFFYDLNKGRDIGFWKVAAVSIISFFVLYFGLTYVLTGSPLSRFQAIAKNGYLNLCSYDQQSVVFLIDRILYQFFDMIFEKGVAISYVFIFAYFIQKKAVDLFKMDNQFSFFTVMSIMLLLSSNFMTISAVHYVPMCLDPRHFLYLVPVAAIPAAYIFAEFLEVRSLKYQLTCVSLIFAIYVFDINELVYWYLYMPLFAILALITFIPARINFKLIGVLLLFVVLGIMPGRVVSYAIDLRYDDQKAICQKYFIEPQEDCYVVTSDVQRSLCEYYNGFNPKSKTVFLAYGEFNPDTLKGKKIYLFKNWYTAYLSDRDDRELPFYARNISPKAKTVFKDSTLTISIYEVPELDNPEEVLLKSVNDFEQKHPYWVTEEKDITTRFVLDGKSSHVLDEYSSTFQYPLNQLDFSDARTVLITANLMCHFNSNTNCKMVISLENEDGNYYWESMNVNKYIHAYNNWWPIKYEAFLPIEQIKPNTICKVYMYNENKETVYIDNFEVKIQKSLK